MKGRISKTRTRRSPLNLSNSSKEKLLDCVLDKSGDSELRSSQQVPAPASQKPPPNPSSELGRKRKRESTSHIRILPVKKARPAGQIPYKSKNSSCLRNGSSLNPAVLDEQPLRRSPRLQARQNDADIENPIRALPPTASHIYRLETSGGGVPLKTERYDLTAKNLQSLDKRNRRLLKTMGKPNQSKGRRFPAVSSSYTRTSTEGGRSAQSKTTSTTSAGFAALALENGVLDLVNSKKPTNYDDHRIRLNRDRETASPTESVYEDYRKAAGTAPNEQTMLIEMIDLLKKPSDGGYRKVFNQSFTGFPKEVGFNNGLSAPQPDLVEGLQRREFRPFPVAEQIDGAVLFKDDPYSLTLPHLAGEWKGPGKDMNGARVQNAYDGAALVYGRDQALNVLGSPDPPGHAAVVSFTTDGSTINFFTHHSAPSQEEGKIEYHQFPITSTLLVNSFEEFKNGRKQLRNLQDDARRESYTLRDRLNDHWKSGQTAANSLPGTGASPYLTGALEEPPPKPADSGLYLYSGGDDELDEPAEPIMLTQDVQATHLASAADLSDAEGNEHEIIGRPAYVPTPPRSSNQEIIKHKNKQRRPSTPSSPPKPGSLFVDNSAGPNSKKHKPSSGKAKPRGNQEYGNRKSESEVK